LLEVTDSGTTAAGLARIIAKSMADDDGKNPA